MPPAQIGYGSPSTCLKLGLFNVHVSDHAYLKIAIMWASTLSDLYILSDLFGPMSCIHLILTGLEKA